MKYKVPAAGICFSAVVLMPGLTGTFCVCPSSLIAQPFQSYEDEARNSVEEYAAQAYTLSDEEGWRSFILSGIADERTRWTAESDELLQKKISQIESSGDENKFQTDLLRAEYETALRAWEMDAENHFLTEKGRFLARKNAMNTVSVDEGVYKSLIAQARAAVSGVLELNLDLWDETVNFLHKKIDETFETSLSDEMERVRNHSRPITAAEYKSFESELKKRELEIRSEFILLDRFYMVRARNQYITGKRIDGESLRNQAAEAEAERIGEQILTEASAEIKKNTELLLNETEVFVQNEAETGSFGISGSETSWQEKIEDIIDEGMKQWSLAEEKMLASRLAWMQARKKSRQEGSEIWKDNEAKLIQAMEDWLGEIRKNILAGRSLWDRKLMDFSKEKENAEKNLFNYIKQEKAKWHSFSGELDGMVEGGGSALLQAKDSYRFYAEVMAAEGWLSGNSVSCPEYGDGEKLCAFYNSERKKLSASISVFESILNEAEGILHSALYSDNSAGGLLTDRRSYAGDLPSVIAGMDSENFLSELTLVMEKRDESFLLYKRDLDDLIISNRYFVKRALEIRDSPGFDFKNASSREELEKIIKSLGSEYDFQKKEMLERIAELPGQLPADTEELIARIDEWFSDSVDENLRLHRKVQNYFFEGLDGYYIRKNENDPYLLTEAEYDREILRRERNRLAARLRQTETVKRYADLAAEYNAGIEIARVTMERAEIEHVRMKIRESAYKILTGDLSVDPSARTNSEIRSSELQRILELNGISKERILNKNKFIKREMEILERAMEGRTVYSGEKIDAIISEINSLSDQNSETLLGGIRTALLDHKKILKENSDKSVIENSWKHIGGLSGFLLDELKILRQEYDLEGLAGEIFDLENLMTRISLDEVRHEIDLLERSLRSGADQIKAAMEEFETAKLNYDQAVRDFNIVQSKDSASIIRIEFENISRQLSGVMKRMFQIETIPGFENAFFDSVDKERLEYLYSVSENQKAETLKEKSSQILSIITNLENSRKKNQYLELILSETDLEGLHEAALADLFQKINSVNVNEEIHPDQFSLEKYDADSVSFYSDNAANALVSEKIDLLKKEKQLNEKLSTENADSTAIEILRQEISDHKIQIIKNAELLIASNRGEEIFWSKLLLQSLEPVEGVSVLPDEETLLMSAEKLEEKAFRTSEILADAVRKFLSENNNSSEPSFSHLLKVLNDKIEVLNQVPDTNLPGFGSVHEISEKEVLSFVRSWIVLNRKQIETAGEIANSDNPFAPNEKWISLLEEANKLRDNSIFFRKFSENIPDSPDHPWVHTYREERRLLIKKLDRILQEQPSSVYSAYLSLASEDRDLMRRYGNVETIRPDISLKKIRHNLEISSAYAAVSWKEAYRKEVVFQNKKIIRRLLPRLESKKSDLNSLISEKAALALELKTALSGSGRESELKIILEEISLRINALLPELKELERQFQKSENYIKESLHPGSTSLLYGYALSLLAAEKQGLEMQQKAHQFFRQKSLIQKEKAQKTDPKEFLMGILGIYKTGPEGNLLMDFRGRPVLSETFYELFSDLDEAQDSAFYFKRILKESSASRLETWMKLLDDWFLDPRRQNIPEELKAAKALLETAFQNYISAKEIIRLARNTDFDSRLILEHALNRQNHAEQQMEKHSSLMNLENRLMESFETAAKDGRLTAENLLSLLINPENFISFYNLRNEVLPESEDKDADEGFRMKIQELQTLTKRLRDSVMEKKLADALGKYSAGLNSGFILKNEDAQPDAEKYFDELSGMSAQKIYSDLDAMSRENFRNSVMNWLKTASVLNPVYADEIMSVLKDDLSDGHELYLKIKSAVEDSELRMKKEFILFAESLHPGAGDSTVSTEDQKMRQLTGALYLMDSSLSFHPEDYPDEFRNLLLVRSFAKAKKIYDGFLSQYSSDLWTERADASLDLSGVNGDFAAYAALKDILYFLKTHPVKAYIENAAAGRSMGDYIQHYYRDRNSEPVKFSAGSLYIEEKVAHFEYERIKKDSLSLPVYLIDETKYFKDFRTFLFVSSFDHYTSENNISLSGASEAEKRKSLETHFDAFLSDPLYSVNSRTFSQRYSGSAERQKLMNLIYDKLNRNLTALHFLPDSLSTMVNEGSIESFYKNPEDLLPEALKTIPDYDTADYRQMAASLGDGALSALAFLETEEYMKGKSPALFLSDEELQVLIDRSGYGDAPEQIQTILSKMLRSQNSIVLPEHLKDENYTVSILRSRKVFDVYFPRGSERNQYEVFQAREGGRIDRIENKFFNALDQSGHQLREKAKRNRGEFFSALAEIYRGDKNNSYFLSLEDSLKKDFEDLKNRLFQSGGGMDTVPKGSVFTSDEITSILENQILYEKIFAYRSDLELVLNGAFSESRKYILGKIQRAATDRLLDAAKRQKTAVLKDFLEKILNEEKAGSALISFKAEFPSEHLQNEYRELLSRAYQDADPSLIKSIASERVLVRRMLEHYMIPDVVLNETEQSLLDPSVSQPSLKGSILLEASKRKILAEKKETEILSSFSGMLAEHERYFKKKGLELEREKQVGIFSETYARSFSYNPAQSASISSFSSYRTFLEPGENQETEGPLFITKEIFTEVAAKRIFEKSNWQEILVPDDAEFYGISEVSADDTNHLKKDSMNEIKRVKAFIQNGMSEQEIFQEFHYANLANHYLESISSFNQAFADLFHAAAMAEKRVSPDTETLMKERFRNAYDAAEGGKKNYEKAAAIGIEFAVNSSARDSESIRRNYKKYADAVRQRHELTARFSDTARRKMLFHMKGSEYISKAAASAAEKYHRAEERLKNESDKKTSDRIKHAELISRYTDLLNESGKQYRKYIYSAQKFNSADSVRNYAQTPYLLAFNQNSDEQTAYLKKRFSDAQTLYDVAAAEFHEKEKQLKTASYKVRTERKIEDLKKIISILSSDNSELAEIIKLPLDDNEKVALYELNEKKHAQNRVLSGEEITKQELLNLRNDYENFHDLIESRSEFINHSLRMTRLRKASEIITAEIERKRAVVEAKRDEFENSLNALMPAHAASESSSDDVIQARNAVYQRLVSVLESGGNLSLEFRSWYYTEAVWAEQAFSDYLSDFMMDYQKASAPQITASQILEAGSGILSAASLLEGDRAAVMIWLANGNQLNEYAAFRQIYYGYLLSLGNLDRAKFNVDLTNLIYGNMLSSGQAMVASGLANVAAGTALTLTVYGASTGIAMINTGTTQLAYGYPMMTLATQKIALSAAELTGAFLQTASLFAASIQSGSDLSRVAEVRRRQKEYESALFELEYLTKAGSLAEVKKRIQNYGMQNRDVIPDGSISSDPLYLIKESDLNYLFEEMDGKKILRDSSGNDISEQILSEEKLNGLDISKLKTMEEYRDAYGVQYDPRTVLSVPPGIRDGGFYKGKDDSRYTRIDVSDGAGGKKTAYAKILEPGENRIFSAYNLGEVLKAAVSHGKVLRKLKKEHYLDEGAGLGNDTLTLKERDLTFHFLLEQASRRENGGREFSGYRTAFSEQSYNAYEIFQKELKQRESIQKKEWNFRKRDLEQSRLEWDQKMDSILMRGQNVWNGVLARYRQKRRSWEKQYDQNTDAELKILEKKTDDFYKNQSAWENKMRKSFTDASIRTEISEVLENINSELDSFNNFRIKDLEKINVENDIAQILDEIKKNTPDAFSDFSKLNRSIENFNGILAVSEMSAGNYMYGLSPLSVRYRDSMGQHAERMKIMAKVIAYEEIKKLKAKIIRQIENQDRTTEMSADGAAYSAGYIKQGDVFIKTEGTLNTTSVIQSYTKFNASSAIGTALKYSGFSDRSGGDLVKFLQDKSDIEVTAFFDMQKSALFYAFEKIMGTGSAEERNRSKDAEILGEYGMWAGRAPNSTAISLGRHAAGNSYSDISGMRYAVFALAGQGFGELGEWGIRPSGKILGFYVQLMLAGEELALQKAKNQVEISSDIDPFSTTVNQINPLTLIANSIYNVEAGSRVYGYDRHKLIGAQGAGILKSALTAGGTAVAASGGPAGWAAGGVMILAGNSIHVDTKNGETNMKITDESALNSALQLGSAAAGGMISGQGTAVLSPLQTAGLASVQTLSSFLSSGMRYTDNGISQGFDLSGVRGDVAMVSAAAGGISSYTGNLGGAAVSGLPGNNAILAVSEYAKGSISTAVSAASEYVKMNVYGQEYSRYLSLQNSDLSSGGSVLGAVLAGKISAALQARRESKLEERSERSMSEPENPFERSSGPERAGRMISALWGAFRNTRAGKWLSGNASGYVKSSDGEDWIPVNKNSDGDVIYLKNNLFVNEAGQIVDFDGNLITVADKGTIPGSVNAKNQFDRQKSITVDGVEYKRVIKSYGTFFEAQINGQRVTYEMTSGKEGIVKHVYQGTKSVLREANVGISGPADYLNSFVHRAGMFLNDLKNDVFEWFSGEISSAEPSGKIMTPQQRWNWLSDFSSRHDVDQRVLEAIIRKEGAGYDVYGNPVIRFEAHKFDPAKQYSENLKYTDGHYMEQYWRSDTSDAWLRYHEGRIRNDKNLKELKVLEWAMAIDEKHALEATSIGPFQLMMANYKKLGYKSPMEMYTAMVKSEFEMYRGFENFVTVEKNYSIGKYKNMLDALQKKDFDAIARYHNGNGWSKQAVRNRAEYIDELNKIYHQILKESQKNRILKLR